MTAPQAGHRDEPPPSACTPAAIRSILAANAPLDVLDRYDRDLDAAFECGRATADLTPLLDTVRRWWFEADAWRDPAAQREFLDRVERYLTDGPPPPEQRVTRDQIRARYGI